MPLRPVAPVFLTVITIDTLVPGISILGRLCTLERRVSSPQAGVWALVVDASPAMRRRRRSAAASRERRKTDDTLRKTMVSSLRWRVDASIVLWRVAAAPVIVKGGWRPRE
jgi:hypothetical protein